VLRPARYKQINSQNFSSYDRIVKGGGHRLDGEDLPRGRDTEILDFTAGGSGLIFLVVLIVGLAAGALSGIIGTGSTITLLPILVYQLGPKQAVPIIAVSAVMANIGKIAAWWREVDWTALAAYAISGVPAAILGAHTLVELPESIIDVTLGLFFLAVIPMRRWLHLSGRRIKLWHLTIAGGVIGFITGLALATGPLSVPAFMAYGLAKGPFLATEAFGSLAMMIAKIATFRELGALPWPAILQGLIIGSAVMVGAFAGKAVVQRMSIHVFHNVLDALLLVSGLSLLWAAYR
jgi:uncharacterized protein